MKEQAQDKRADNPRLMTRRQLERQERSRRARRVLWLFIGVALLIGVTIPATGYYLVYVQPLQETIVTVNNVSYNMDYVLRRARRTLVQAASIGSADPEASTDIIMGVLQEVQQDQIVLQAAPREGIAVTDQDIRQRLDAELGSSLVGENDPNRRDQSFDQLYKARLNVLKFSDKEYKDIIKAQIIRTKLEDRLKASLPVHDEQVHVLMITVKGQNEAQQVLNRLRAGEDFGFVARDVSQDVATKNNGGDYGWYARGMKPDFESTWFALKAGQVSAPVYVAETIYIFKIAEREEARELAEEQRRILSISRFQTWMEEERPRHQVSQVWDQTRYLYVHDKLHNDPDLKAYWELRDATSQA